MRDNFDATTVISMRLIDAVLTDAPVERIQALLDQGASSSAVDGRGYGGLTYACVKGSPARLAALLARWRNDVDRAFFGKTTALMTAVLYEEVDCARLLLEAGACPNRVNAHGVTALMRAPTLALCQLLCSYGADREPVIARASAWSGAPQGLAWLCATQSWISPLHHVRFLSTVRVRALLGGGADIHAIDGSASSPSPLTIARAVLADGDAPQQHTESAALIVAAAGPWSPSTHALFPAGARAYAVQLFMLGQQLQLLASAYHDQAYSLADPWVAHVMARLVER